MRRARGRRPRPRRCCAASGSTSAEKEVDVRVAACIGELRRNRVRAEPGRDPPASLIARSCASSVSRSSPYPDFASNVVVPARSIQPTCSASAAASTDSPAARVARTVERIPPPRACSSSYVAPPARSENSSTRSPAKHACVWQSTRPGIAESPRPSISSTSSSSDPRSRIGPTAAMRPPSQSTYASVVTVDVAQRRAAERRVGPGRATRPARGRGSAAAGIPRAELTLGAGDRRQVDARARARRRAPPRSPRRRGARRPSRDRS